MKINKLLYLIIILNLIIGTPVMAGQYSGSVYVIGTGGTIAGSAKNQISNHYDAGKFSANQLLDSIPQLRNTADIKVLDLFQIDSGDITIENWLILASSVNNLLKKSDIKGVVITHGTDTLEETAYFLNLVIKSNKPVVLVGSMRPATSISADGPINLYNAIAVANSSDAIGKGVIVVMNDQIFDARDVTKTNTTRTSTFNAANTGPIGSVNFGKVNISKMSTKIHTADSPFDVYKMKSLPHVEIIYEYAGTSGHILESVINDDSTEGIVIAGSGDGNIAEPERALLKKARAKGIIVVRSSRTGSGSITFDSVHHLDTEIGLIAANDLNPQKARILLMLALTKTKDVSIIRKYFASC